MLTNNMTLKQMLSFKPSSLDMAMLPLDVVLYIKVHVVSLSKEEKYDIIRFFFNDPDIKEYIKDLNKTIVYDFDGTNTNKERFVSILELYGTKNFTETSDYLKDLLQLYTNQAETLINIYTHDDKAYLLSNLDGIVKLEELNNEQSVQ